MVVPKIYVCMTSIPFRSKRLPFVIDSLLKNNILPDKIIVNLCENYERFPEDKFDISVLNKYKNNDLITINNNCKDYGPGTKILGCLDKLLETEKDIENVYLLTADDDLLYKPTFIEEFKRCILLDSTKSYTGYQSNRGLKINNINLNISFGADGISFKLSQLKKLKNFCLKLFETDIKFKYHDDFCFACYFNLNNIKTERTKKSSRYPENESNYKNCDMASLTNAEVGSKGGGIQRDNMLCRKYSQLLESKELDIFKI